MGVDEIIGGGRLVLVSEERRDANMVSQPTTVGCEHTEQGCAERSFFQRGGATMKICGAGRGGAGRR